MAESAGTIVVRVVTDDRASAGLKKIQGNLSRLGKGAEGGGLKKLVGGLGQLEQGFSRGEASGLGMLEAVGGVGAGAMAAAAGVAAVVGGLFAFTVAGNKANAQADQFKMQIRALSASADEADAAFTALDDFADTTLFNDTQVFSAGRALLAAGMAAKDLVPTLEILQAASGQNGETFAALSDSFATLSSRSVATSKNLISLQQAGKIDVFGILAEQMGKSREEIKGLAAGGKLLTKQVLPMLLKGIGETTKGLNDEMRQSLPFLESEFGNAAEDASKAWSKGLEPISKSIYGGLGQSFRALEAIFKDVFSNPIVQDFIGALQEGLGALGDVASAVGGVLKDVFSVLGFVLIPITYALKAFAAVWRLIADAIRVVNRFLKPFWDALRAIGAQLKAVIDWAAGWVAVLGQVAKSVMIAIGHFVDWVLQSAFVKAALELIVAVANLVIDGAQRLADWVQSLVDDFIAWWKESETVQRALQGIWNWIQKIAGVVASFTVGIVDRATSVLKSISGLIDDLHGRTLDVQIADKTEGDAGKIQQRIDRLTGTVLPVNVNDQTPQPIANIQNRINRMTGTVVPIDINDQASGPIAKIQNRINNMTGTVVPVNVTDQTPSLISQIQNRINDMTGVVLGVVVTGLNLVLDLEAAINRLVDKTITVTTVTTTAPQPSASLTGSGATNTPSPQPQVQGPPAAPQSKAPPGIAVIPGFLGSIAVPTYNDFIAPSLNLNSGGDLYNHGCFTADTRIATEHGSLRIADVVVGQLVDVWDSESVVRAPVSELHIHKDHPVWFLRIEGDTCHTTAEHPWLTPSGWVRADELVAGSHVMTPSGIETVQDSHAAGWTATVYNITVDHVAHTYLVGTARWIVHNKMALAKGGIVSSPTVALIGEKGAEAVVPLDRAFGPSGGIGGVSIGSLTINVAGFADPAAAGASAADAFRRQLGLQRRLPFGTS